MSRVSLREYTPPKNRANAIPVNRELRTPNSSLSSFRNTIITLFTTSLLTYDIEVDLL
jgi:hypothetical protein